MTGLGDLIAWITEKLGIGTSFDCGCNERREWFNRWFPFR